MRSVAPMQAAKIGYIVLSAALCALGIALIVLPDFSEALLGLVCGILLIVFGAVRLVGFFSRDLYRLGFQYDLAFGILLIVLGGILLLCPDGLMTFLCISLGLSILTDGLFKIQIAMESRRFGIRGWWLILALAVLAAVFGLLLMLRPGENSRVLMAFFGIALLAEGILNFSTVLTAVKIVKNQRPDVVLVYEKESED